MGELFVVRRAPPTHVAHPPLLLLPLPLQLPSHSLITDNLFVNLNFFAGLQKLRTFQGYQKTPTP